MNIRKIVCALGGACVVLSSVAGTVWKDSSPVGKDSLVVSSGDLRLRVDPIAENLFRVRVTKEAYWSESGLNRYGVLTRDWAACPVSRKGNGLKTGAATVAVAADAGGLAFKSLVSAADLKIDARLAGKGYRVRIPLTKDERIYGLGDVSRDNIQRRPGKYEIWVKNVNSYIPMPMAISSKGWGILMNTTWRNTVDVGQGDPDALVCEAGESPLDFFVFCGRDYRAILDIYTRLTGRPALLPCFGYGFTYVCNENVDAFRLMDESMEFRDRDLPCDVIGLEPGWMEKTYDYTTRKEWNKQRFKFPYWAPAGGHTFVGALNRIGFKLSLWLCVDYDLFRYEEQCAAGEAKKSGGLVELPEGIAESWEDDRIGTDEEKKKKAAENRKSKLVDGGADLPEGKAPWFEHLKKFVQQGAQCFKLDGSNQVGEHPKRDWANGKTDEENHNLYPLVYDKQMARGYEDFTQKRAMVYSVSGYVGLQQFVATWAGDTGGGPRSCASLLNLGMSGHSNTSCDMGIHDAKSLHFGMLQSWSQQNNWCYWRQPWYQPKKGVERFRQYLQLRYRLFPYIYTAAAEAHATGWPMMRPLPFVYPENPAYDACKTTYMLGPDLLVCAYTNEAEIPSGKWYEWRTDRVVAGPTKEKLDLTPMWGGGLYVRAGAMIPTWPVRQSIDCGWNRDVVYEVYTGADGSGNLYEDDGLTLNYLKGGAHVANTRLTLKDGAAESLFTIGSREGGAFGGNRNVTVRFHGLAAAPKAALADGKPVTGTWNAEKKVYSVGPVVIGANGAAFKLTKSGLAYGPVGNAADQFRFIWGTGLGWNYTKEAVPYFGEMCRIGLNTHINGQANFFQDIGKDAPVADMEKRQAFWKTYLDACEKAGVGMIQQCPFAHDKWLGANYPRINRDGTKDTVNIDVSQPEALARSRRAAETLGRSCAHPAVIGIQNASEIRDGCHPSFTPEMRAAYRAHSGHDIPAEVFATTDKSGRTPPHWKTLKDFPKDRIVDDDHPVLDFYVWSWKKGDGWCDWLTDVAQTAAKATGRNVFTMYDPSLRTPPLWGSGGDVTFLNHWTYVYPEPYNISYNISEQHSRAKKTGQGVLAMIQAISYRSQLAPIGEHPANEPKWTSELPLATYPTTPPDMVREAMWTVFSRKVDGIGFHGWNALWDGYAEIKSDYLHPTNRGYRCANPLTREVIGEVFNTVGIPLGPLFRAIPERAPKVALVESYASMILGSRITWDCSGRYFDYGTVGVAANLMPATLTEDEIRDFGIPDSVEALVMVNCDVLTRKCYEKIAAFKARGGRIVADATLCPALKADAPLPELCTAFPPTASDHDDGKASPATGAEKRERSVRAAAAALRAAVGPKAAPYADSDKPDILVSARTYATSDYVFAINDRRAYGDYVGPWKRVKEKGLPNAGTVTVNRSAGAVYDLVRHAAVPFSVRDGKTTIGVSYETTDGKVFLVAERPLGELKVEISGRTLTVTSSDRNVLIPIRVDGLGEKPFYAVVKDGAWSRTIECPTDELAVTNLADGKVAKAAK